jgi:hypothetical protein
MLRVSRPAAGRQAVGVSWQVRREMVGVSVAYINEAVSPHWLRHAHDSHAIDPGATLPEVQATLGHASVSTTSGYLHARTDTSRAPRPGSVSSLRMRATDISASASRNTMSLSRAVGMVAAGPGAIVKGARRRRTN